MTLTPMLRRALLACGLIAAVATGAILGQQKYGMPKTVIHVVTLKWTDASTPEQRQKALDGIKTMAATIPGIKNVWLRTVKVQGQTAEGQKPYDAAFVMEFADEAALKDYATHPKHKEWEEIYVPLRAESRSHDISN